MIRAELRHRASNSLACAFTGHRPAKLGYTPELTQRLRVSLNRELLRLVGQNYTHFLSGCALGFDLLAAQEVVSLRRQLPFITLEMVLPWRGQAERWSAADRSDHAELLARADAVTVLQEEYTQGCLFARNRHLVNAGDVLLAFYRDLPGGTRMTIDYARSCGKKVILLEEDA